MARQPIQAEYTTFVKGLITEASPLTYPENASLEEENFVLNPDGSRQRRFGMDYEDGYSLVNTGVDVISTSAAISSFTWTTVANRQSLDFAVIQVGNSLYFFKSNSNPTSINRVNGGNAVVLSGDATQTISCASIYGFLVVAHGTQDVNILSYNETTDVITLTTKRIKIRDLFGVDDGYEVDFRPVASLTPEHLYNLRNQGWPPSMKGTTGEMESVSDVDPITQSGAVNGYYPSNADIVWAAKISAAKTPIAIGAFYAAELGKLIFGSTPAPKGRFVIDAFYRGANRGLTGKADQSGGGVTSVASYAGRVFYAVKETSRFQTDMNSPHIGTMVFYSSVSDNVNKLADCYSEADPSAEHSSDPIATDGGFVNIPEAGEIIKLMQMGTSLFVFCSNGVWEIHGGEEPFSATNQNVTKITDVGAVSAESIVYAEDKIAYWGLSGIYLIAKNDLTLRGSNNDLTFKSIQSIYDKLSVSTKKNAVGVYDPFVRTIRWLYQDVDLGNPSLYNKELIFDVGLGAFYMFSWNVSTAVPLLSGYVKSDAVLPTRTTGLPSKTESVLKSSLKYLTVVDVGSTHSIVFSHFNNEKFKDWTIQTTTGIDAPAHLLTGYMTGGSGVMSKDLSYVYVFMKRTELGVEEDGTIIDPSSCMMQVQWDWTNHTSAGKWSRTAEVYRLPRIYSIESPFEYAYTTVVSKNKIRGNGRAMSILFSTVPGHNCHIYGWSILGSAGVK